MLKHFRNFYHPFKFSTLIINFSEVWPRQILDLGKQFNLMIRLENVLKTSWRRMAKTNILVLIKTSWRCHVDVFWRQRGKTPSRRFHQDECLKTFLQYILKTYWKRLEDVLKTYAQDKYIGLDQDVLKTSSRRFLKTKSKDVFKTSSSRQVFAGN